MKATKRLLAILLVLIMSLSVMGVSAYADVIVIDPANSGSGSDEQENVVIEEELQDEQADPIVIAPEEEEFTEESGSTIEHMMIVHDPVTADMGGVVESGETISAVLTALDTPTDTVFIEVQQSFAENAAVNFEGGDYEINDGFGCTITAGKNMDYLFGFTDASEFDGTVSLSNLTLNGAGKAKTGLMIEDGAFTISDCVLDGFAVTAIDFNGASMVIDGGTYGPITAGAGTATLRDGSFDNISVSGGDVVIQGGSFGAISAESGTLSIHDGYFSKLPTGSKAVGSISGGYFKSKPGAALLADGKKVVSVSVSGYGYRVVAVAEDASGDAVLATINGENVTDLNDLYSISDPATVILRQNVNLSDVSFELGNGSDVVWDLNGFTLDGPGAFTVSSYVEVKNGTLGEKVVVDGSPFVLGEKAKLSGGVDLKNGAQLECDKSNASVAGTVKVLDEDSKAIISAGSFGNILTASGVDVLDENRLVTGGTFGGNEQLESDFVDVDAGYSVTKSGSKYLVSMVSPVIKYGTKAISEFTYEKGSTAKQDKVFTTNLPVESIDAYQDDGNANLSLFGTLVESADATAENPMDYELSKHDMVVTIKGSGSNMADMYKDAEVGSGKFILRFNFANGQSKDLVMNIAPSITVDPENYTHKSGDGKDMVFTSSDAFDDVYIMKPGSKDLIAIEGTNRTVDSDSKVLTLKAAYLDKLASGTYTVVFDFGHGGQFGIPMIINKASTAATTAKPTIVSATGDTIPYASALLTAGLNFKVTPANNISSVEVDGVALTEDVHYTLSSAGVLNLKSNYIMSLPFGDHTVTVTNGYGSASMTFRTGPGILPLNGIRTHTKGGSNTLTYVTTHPITSIAVAGTTISSTNYALSADGRTITFTAAFLNSLQVGTYSVTATVNTGDGYLRQVSSSMEIISQYAAASTPATGDTSNLGLWIGLMVAALALFAVVVFILKRKPEEAPAENVKAPQNK